MTITILEGDCRTILPTLSENSVHCVVTDPPYHLTSITKRFGATSLDDNTDTSERSRAGADGMARLARGFMGKTWDGGDVSFQPETWTAVGRVLKPGGYLLAFGGTRTFHRMAIALEDAGFIMHPFIAWVFGSGFPKAHKVLADGWEGWRYGGQALKPAIEPILMVQKPFSERTGTANVEKHGTGAINVDGCRVDSEARPHVVSNRRLDHTTYSPGLGGSKAAGTTDVGRWPANLIHDGSDEVLAAFPDAPGQIADASSSETRKTQNVYSPGMKRGNGRDGEATAEKRYTDRGGTDFAMKPGARRGDTGSAARFFYCAKADRAEREEGCDHLPARTGGMVSETSGQHVTRRDGGAPGKVRNHHPTVKPVALMRYLVRLVTPPGGIVLDPFMGSGSTGKAAEIEGFNFIGIEREPEYIAIARSRIGADAPLFGTVS